MAISPGFTDDEIRGFVYEYDLVPHGKKTAWLEDKPFSRSVLRRWSRAVYDGDLSRGLVPRRLAGAGSTTRERQLMAREHMNDESRAQIEELEDEVRRLKEANETLGKAIGLLHEHSAQRPDDTPTPQTPSDSSMTRTPSSAN